MTNGFAMLLSVKSEKQAFRNTCLIPFIFQNTSHFTY